jgi:hypothetical protein
MKRALKHLSTLTNSAFSSESCDKIPGAPLQLLSFDISDEYDSNWDTEMEREKHFENILSLTPKLDYLESKGIRGYHYPFTISSLPRVPY